MLAAAGAAAPLPAAAAELTFDQFGATEQVALIFPWIFFGLAYIKWRSSSRGSSS